MIVHLGRSVNEVDAKQAAHENRIVACLHKRGPMRENDVKLYTAAIRSVGREIHAAAVENLVAHGVIRKLTTTRSNSFILELLNGEVEVPQPDPAKQPLASRFH